MPHTKLMAFVEEKINEAFQRYNKGLISEEEAARTIKSLAIVMYDQVERMYDCKWTDRVDVVHIEYFTPDRGYDIDTFKKIANLKKDETCTVNSDHKVTRIK